MILNDVLGKLLKGRLNFWLVSTTLNVDLIDTYFWNIFEINPSFFGNKKFQENVLQILDKLLGIGNFDFQRISNIPNRDILLRFATIFLVSIILN